MIVPLVFEAADFFCKKKHRQYLDCIRLVATIELFSTAGERVNRPDTPGLSAHWQDASLSQTTNVKQIEEPCCVSISFRQIYLDI